MVDRSLSFTVDPIRFYNGGKPAKFGILQPLGQKIGNIPLVLLLLTHFYRFAFISTKKYVKPCAIVEPVLRVLAGRDG